MAELAEQLQRFVAEKEALARSVAASEGKRVLPELENLFAAARRDDLEGIENVCNILRQAGPPRDLKPYCLHASQWSVALEIWGAFRELSPPNYYVGAFGRDVIASIPAGNIYFGGTDAGRFVVSALCESHTNADPFFTVTQNALMDKTYLRYLRTIYSDRIWLPTEEDYSRVYDEYVQDALKRRNENKLRPGEDLTEVNGKIEVRGQIGVMTMNGAMARLIFDKNPDREFYIQESFPLEWMYPHLQPYGLVMKINREPTAGFSEDVVQRNRESWTRHVRPMLGPWLDPDTPLSETAAFVEKVHLNRDFSAFHGDLQYLEDQRPQRIFSKLRSSIGGLYAWHAQRVSSAADKDRLTAEAEFAFRQAFALCPRSPEAVFRYINELVTLRRFDDAILVSETARKLEPENGMLQSLANELIKMKLKAVA